MDIYEKLKDEAAAKVGGVQVLDYIVGLKYVGVKTTAGTGLGYLDSFEAKSCNFVEEEYIGADASVLLDKYFNDNSLDRAFAVAVMNAVLNNGQDDSPDMFDKFDFSGKKIGMIGLFRPLEKRIRNFTDDFNIFEQKEIEGTFRPEQAKDILPLCDITLITSVTLVNHTFHEYMPHLNKDGINILLGPSTPMAECLSEYCCLAGSEVTDPEKAFRTIQHGGGAPRLKSSTRKVWKDKNVQV